MDKKYNELFTLLVQAVANLAETVMEQHKKNNDEKAFSTAERMRNDYMDLHDKLTENKELDKADFARLLVGAIIMVNQLDSQVKSIQKALDGYKIDIIPKLDQINNEPDKAKAVELAKELFAIKEEKSDI